MDLGVTHVVGASAALTLGLCVLVRRKGGRGHRALGRAYLGAMTAVNVPALFLYQTSGGPGPFHVLAVVSVLTTGAGWWSVRGGGARADAVRRHAELMTWSWIGVATAGIAQLANRVSPDQAPWPVLTVVSASTALGLTLVPRLVSRQLRRRDPQRARTVPRGAETAASTCC